MDTISFGSDREPWLWPRRWRLGGPRPGRRARLVLVAVTAAVVIVAIALINAGGRAHPARHEPGLPALLTGSPAGRAYVGLFLGGENLWWDAWRPRAVATALLHDGLSSLLPSSDGADADQVAAVPGGVVAHVSDISSGITYGGHGRVLFLPAAAGPARVIARATMIAVAPGGRRVWVQAAVQRLNNGEGVGPGFRSPTWAVNLAGRRVSPVLRLPFGLAGATGRGPLTENLSTGRLQLWDGTTGRLLPLPVPASANFVAAGRDQLVWASFTPSAALHVTDLRTGSDVTVSLPPGWTFPSQSYPPPSASLDPAGRRLVLALDRTGPSGDASAEALFVVNLQARTLQVIPGARLPFPGTPGSLADTLAGSWNRHGLLWVLAMSPDGGYYQLGYWTGTGPLRILGIGHGSPAALSPPGPS